jgi:protein TonB
LLGLGVTMKKFAGVFAAVSLIAGLGAAPAYAFQEPELVQAEAPEFPRAAQRREIEGHVVVRYNVSADGAVSDVEVVEATPAGVFERSVMRALESWQYATGPGAEGVERRFDFNFGD